MLSVAKKQHPLPQVFEGCRGLVYILPGHNRDVCWIESLCSPALITHEASTNERYSAIAVTFEDTTLLQNHVEPAVALHIWDLTLDKRNWCLGPDATRHFHE